MREMQRANQTWWNANPMTYDWHRTLGPCPGTREWFDEIDRRLFNSADFARGVDGEPFGRFLRRDAVRGKSVLEVGCGMGSHAVLLARSGARLTAIDLTARAVEMTRRRLDMLGLPARIEQADSEDLPFKDASFDVVWSWGVIHHSASTERCISEIARVLRPGGRLVVMVYYRHSLVRYLHCGAIRGVMFGELRRRTLDEIYTASSDGFTARVFSRGELSVALSPYFDIERTSVVGMRAELFPVPRSRVKDWLEGAVPQRAARAVLDRWGSMIVAEVRRWALGERLT